jgi:hypothetical protein
MEKVALRVAGVRKVEVAGAWGFLKIPNCVGFG